MARVLIVGGHGKVALALAKLLTERGDDVTSVFRNPEHADEVAGTGARPEVLDVESADVDALSELLTGQDAVVFSAGAGGGDADRTRAVDRDAAIHVIDAATRAGADRFVMVSYFGAGHDDVDPSSSFAAYAQAKAAADEHLRESSLRWTILGPSSLTTDEATGRIEVADPSAAGAPAPEKASVSRANVALVAAAVLLDDATIGRTIDFNDGDTPIEAALAG